MANVLFELRCVLFIYLSVDLHVFQYIPQTTVKQ